MMGIVGALDFLQAAVFAHHNESTVLRYLRFDVGDVVGNGCVLVHGAIRSIVCEITAGIVVIL